MIELHLLEVATDSASSRVITAWNPLNTSPHVWSYAFLHAGMCPHYLAPPIQIAPGFGPVENSNSSFKISAQYYFV